MKLSSCLIFVFFFTLSQVQNNIETKFLPPVGYERIYNDEYSKFLRQHPLKNDNIVYYSNGKRKYYKINNKNIWAAVFDYDIGKRDLHQCADAAIYLRAAYHYSKGPKFYDRLSYSFTNGYLTTYNDWLNGEKINLIQNGTDVLITYGDKREDNYISFRKWLDLLFTYAGTWSINEYDLDPVSINDMKPGDVFVEGGFPGHAVTVVDVAVNPNNEKVFMLAQSFMPAQEQHVLLNPKDNSVWYKLGGSNIFYTPEYTFESNQLKRFKN